MLRPWPASEHRRHPDAYAYEFGRSAAPPTMASVLRTGEPVDAGAHRAHRERHVEVRLVVRLQLERREERHCLVARSCVWDPWAPRTCAAGARSGRARSRLPVRATRPAGSGTRRPFLWADGAGSPSRARHRRPTVPRSRRRRTREARPRRRPARRASWRRRGRPKRSRPRRRRSPAARGTRRGRLGRSQRRARVREWCAARPRAPGAPAAARDATARTRHSVRAGTAVRTPSAGDSREHSARDRAQLLHLALPPWTSRCEEVDYRADPRRRRRPRTRAS